MKIVIHVCDNITDANNCDNQLRARVFARTHVVPVTVNNVFRLVQSSADDLEVRNNTNPPRDIVVVIGLNP